MIEIHKDNVGGIPVLQAVASGKSKEKLPLVIFVHGFTSAKEHNLHFAYLLAEKGFRAVLPEAELHGERENGVQKDDLMFSFWRIVLRNIQELGQIKDYYTSLSLADESRIGIAGTSMGGITALGALTQYDWIKAAVSLMGSPCYSSFARAQVEKIRESGVAIPYSEEELEKQYDQVKPFDLSDQPEKLRKRPLMFWHGMKDDIVPYHPTRRFYDELLKGDYKNSPERLQFITDKQAGHKVSREGLLKTVEWFERYL